MSHLSLRTLKLDHCGLLVDVQMPLGTRPSLTECLRSSPGSTYSYTTPASAHHERQQVRVRNLGAYPCGELDLVQGSSLQPSSIPPVVGIWGRNQHTGNHSLTLTL